MGAAGGSQQGKETQRSSSEIRITEVISQKANSGGLKFLYYVVV